MKDVGGSVLDERKDDDDDDVYKKMMKGGFLMWCQRETLVCIRKTATRHKRGE